MKLTACAFGVLVNAAPGVIGKLPCAVPATYTFPWGSNAIADGLVSTLPPR
jgi:hypothetical protein